MKFYRQIFLFNKPAFVAAAVVVIACVGLFLLPDLSPFLKIIVIAIAAGTIYLSAGSLFFSYLIYDVSDLYSYNWLKPFLGKDKICFNLFSGYSEGGFMLEKVFEKKWIRQMDFFETGIAVTASIIKAKELSRVIDSSMIKYNDWKDAGDADMILFMQSLHELRPLQQKTDCLREASRHLNKNGNIIIAEHLCDWKNFLIYGPGAFHFFGDRHWKRSIASSGLLLEKIFFITPFIKVYVLKNNS
jgi:hypothetical protein